MSEVVSGYDTTFAVYGTSQWERLPSVPRALFDELDIEARIAYLLKFLDHQGVAVEPTRESVVVIDDWLASVPAPHLDRTSDQPGSEFLISDGWKAFAVDLGLLCGDIDTRAVPTRLCELLSPYPPQILASPTITNIPGLATTVHEASYVSRAAMAVCARARRLRGYSDNALHDAPVRELLTTLAQQRRSSQEIADESVPRLSEERAQRIYAQSAPHRVGYKVSKARTPLPKKVEKRYKQLQQEGEPRGSGDITVYAALPLERINALIENAPQEDGKPSKELRAFAKELLRRWPDFDAHDVLASPYEENPLQAAGVETLNFQIHGSAALIDAICGDVEAIAEQMHLHVYYWPTGKLKSPENPHTATG